MNQKTHIFRNILATAVTATAISISTGATAAASSPPRGPDVEQIAGNCRIGPFHQTVKAGAYNAICDQMSDSEKCLALIKQHFDGQGTAYPASDKARMEYCLEELDRILIGVP